MNNIGRYCKDVGRSIPRVSIFMLVVGLVSGPGTARADDIVLRWNQIAAQTATAANPFDQARIGAIVQLAVFEAVNAVTGEYEPYLNRRRWRLRGHPSKQQRSPLHTRF